jgi:hypothetical protein
MKKTVYFLINGEGSIILALASKPQGFDDAHYKLVEKELEFPADFDEHKQYYLDRLLNRKPDQVELA